MSPARGEIPPGGFNSAFDLDALEGEIRAALRGAWIMLGLLLAASLGTSLYILSPHL